MSNFGYPMPRYFQNMPQIGKALNSSLEDNATEMKQIEADIAAEIERSTNAGTPDEKLHKRGLLTPMERLEQLIDPGTWCPMNSLYNPYENKDGSTAILTGLAKINDRWSIVIVSDHKKMAGVWVGGQAYKLCQALEMAYKLRVPVVYVLNCSGIKLDEQERVMAARVGGGTPFYRHAKLNQAGIPIIVGIFGTNPAGGGYHAVTPTIQVAHEKANMAVGGAGIVGGMKPKGHMDEEGAMELIKATKSAGKVAPLGNVEIHYNETGLFREVYGTEEGVLDALKKYVGACNAYDENFYRVAPPMEPKYEAEDLYSLIPMNQRRAYDVKEILARLFDNSEYREYKADYGPEITCGLARFNGLLAGIVANNQGIIMNYPEYRKNGAAIGGKLYRQGLMKMNEFVTMCSRDRIPVIWFQDTTGIDVGEDAEKEELLALGAGLIYSVQNSQKAGIPHMEVTLRKGSGAAHYVMGGPQANDTNTFSIGTAATEIYVMNSETAAAAMYARRLVKEHDAGHDIQPVIDEMNAMIEKYRHDSRPNYCAQHGFLDEIVSVPEIRKYICAFVGAAYQNPISLCPFDQMMVPRMIRDWDNKKNWMK